MMKQIAMSLTVVLVLVLVAAFAEPGATDTAADMGLIVEVDDRNPWTNLVFNNKPRDFQFAILTDRTGGRRPGVFTKAIERINLLQPEFVLSVGDLIEGGTEDPGMWALEWSEFCSKVEELQMPFFFCAGNHDISNLPMREDWAQRFGRSYYHFRYRDVLFVVLNTEDPPDTEEPYNFSVLQQEWARSVLDRNQDVRWTFVILHKPTWTYTETDPIASGWTAIEETLAGRPYTVFAGHKHEYAKYIRRGQEYYMLATTGGGSNLSGLANGKFDHFVWVTMKDGEPVIANLLLDGIENEDVRTLPDPALEVREAE